MILLDETGFIIISTACIVGYLIMMFLEDILDYFFNKNK